MHTVSPVTFTLAGVERELRSTIGAHQMIEERFGCGINEAMKQKGVKSLPFVAFALMHDAEGNPPPGVTEKSISFGVELEQFPALAAAVMSAVSQGKTSKNELEALIVAAMEREVAKIGSPSGPSALSASDSQTSSSGGDTSNARFLPESSNLSSLSEPGTTDSESLQHQS